MLLTLVCTGLLATTFHQLDQQYEKETAVVFKYIKLTNEKVSITIENNTFIMDHVYTYDDLIKTTQSDLKPDTYWYDREATLNRYTGELIYFANTAGTSKHFQGTCRKQEKIF